MTYLAKVNAWDTEAHGRMERDRRSVLFPQVLEKVGAVALLLRGYAPPTNEEAAAMLEAIVAKAKGE